MSTKIVTKLDRAPLLTSRDIYIIPRDYTPYRGVMIHPYRETLIVNIAKVLISTIFDTFTDLARGKIDPFVSLFYCCSDFLLL